MTFTLPDGEWKLEAACRGTNVDFANLNHKDKALAICATCPVKTECLRDAFAVELQGDLSIGFVTTIRGGLLPVERLAWMKRYAKVFGFPPRRRSVAECGTPAKYRRGCRCFGCTNANAEAKRCYTQRNAAAINERRRVARAQAA